MTPSPYQHAKGWTADLAIEQRADEIKSDAELIDLAVSDYAFEQGGKLGEQRVAEWQRVLADLYQYDDVLQFKEYVDKAALAYARKEADAVDQAA